MAGLLNPPCSGNRRDYGGERLPEQNHSMLNDFGQNTRSSGSSAEAAAYIEIKVPDENGRSVFGVGIDTSITLAPIKAVISAINRI